MSLNSQTAVDRGFRFAADGAVVGAPIVENDGTVYCATDGGTLYSVTPAGVPGWTARLGGKPVLIMKTGDGIILAATVKGFVEGYNRRGARVVDFPAAPSGPGILSVFETPEGRLLLALEDGTLVLFTISGKKLLSWKSPARFSCPPAMSSEGLIACGTEDGRFLVYGPSGTVIREFPVTTGIRALSWDGPGKIAAAGRDGGISFFLLAGPAGEDPDPGTGSFSGPFQGKIDSIRPLPAGETLLRGEGGDLVLLDPNGREKWSFRGGNVRGTVHDGEGNIFIAGYEGELFGYDNRGNRLWAASLQGSPGPPGLSENGRYLAVGGSNWVLHLFEFIRFGEDVLRTEAPAGKPAFLNTDPAKSAHKREFDYIFLMERAASPYPNRKMEGLAELEDRFAKGRMGKSLDYAAEILAYLILEPYPGRGSSGGRSVPDLPDIRVRAVRLLGGLGSRVDADFLLDVLFFESEPRVAAEIIRAFGAMKRDPYRTVRRGIFNGLFTRSVPPPVYTAQSVLDTLESITSFQGDGLGSVERSILFGIMGGPYPRQVRSAAEALSRKKLEPGLRH